MDRPSTWVRHQTCDGCRAECCKLPIEVSAADLVRLGVCTGEEATRSMKKLFRRLRREGVVESHRAGTDLFVLRTRTNGDCRFLNAVTRRCDVYERRPEVCREFPAIGPRPDYCPANRV